MQWTEKDKNIYSGICLCGHSYEDHHLGMVANPEFLRATNETVVPQECEYFGCNEDGGMDNEGNYHCGQYIDKDNPNIERRNEWKGTYIPVDEKCHQNDGVELEEDDKVGTKSDRNISIVVYTVIIIAVFSLWIVSSYMEAKTYTRITGKNVSTWDAMWVEFRIQEGVK